ncbi:MAG: glutamyl-tRNA reductase, partial [Solirubrobacteraceae bacterium]
MSAELLALGLSHKTAPVALRERIALQEGQAVDFVRALVDGDPIAEAVAISTCNRTALFVVAGDAVAGETAALGALARLGDIRPTELAGSGVYSLRNCDAARHLYRVTSGLESMIVGENEVQGQVRRAYESALGAGTTGPLTNRLFAAALATGKRVRTETALGTGPPSLSSVAVELARQVLGDLEDRSVLV